MKRVLVYGFEGALGKQLVNTFKAAKYEVTTIDVNVTSLPIALSPSNSHQQTFNLIHNALESQPKFNTIVSVAGGWTGGSIMNDGVFGSVDSMMNQSFYPSLICSKLAAFHLEQNGLLVLTGASATLSGTKDMVAYGVAKAAVLHLIKSIEIEGVRTIGMLPGTLDTPNNRMYMKDDGTWTKLEDLASEVLKWSDGNQAGLFKVETVGGLTSFKLL